MIRRCALLLRFEDQAIRRSRPDHEGARRIHDAMVLHARRLGSLPPRDPLDGIEVDIRLARALSVRGSPGARGARPR